MQVAGKTISEVIDRPYVYVELPSGDGSRAAESKPWLRANVDTFTQPFGGSSLGSSGTDPTQTLSFLKAVGSVVRVDIGEVHGTFATRYHAMVQLDRYAGAVSPSERALSRGLVASSRALLARVSAKPTSAMHTPVGTKIHHDPVSSAVQPNTASPSAAS